MSNELNLFHFDDGRQSFEDLGESNGSKHWCEAAVRDALGYKTDDSFARVINRAKQACLSLNIACEDHFERLPDGTYRITRFGCYLLAMNGDPKKPEVAAAQAYFATLAETFQNHIDHTQAIERMVIRDEVTDGQKQLGSTAKSHGVQRYDFFYNKGYMGMYNMSLEKLVRYKGVPDGEKLIDRMSRAELAAHLFRITQTDERIKNDNIRGQAALERAAHDVGMKVRHTVMELSGQAPEDIPIAPHIKDVKKQLKGTTKRLAALDKPSKERS